MKQPVEELGHQEVVYRSDAKAEDVYARAMETLDGVVEIIWLRVLN